MIDAMNELIVVDPNIMVGKPVVRGTRITVEHILTQLRHGRTIDELLEGYPTLTREGIEAAVAFAIEAVHMQRAVAAAS